VPLTPIGSEYGKGRLKIAGLSVEEATKRFREAAYGAAF
jgi:hypothetical protein